MFLCQGTNTIEDYTGQFCALYNHLKWKDAVFKDFYCYGLNKPLRSCMPRGRNELNLEHCMDYALLLRLRRMLPLNIFFGRGQCISSSGGHRAWQIKITTMSSDDARYSCATCTLLSCSFCTRASSQHGRHIRARLQHGCRTRWPPQQRLQPSWMPCQNL